MSFTPPATDSALPKWNSCIFAATAFSLCECRNRRWKRPRLSLNHKGGVVEVEADGVGEAEAEGVAEEAEAEVVGEMEEEADTTIEMVLLGVGINSRGLFILCQLWRCLFETS